MSFTTTLLTSDPETREYNLLLTGTLCGFVKLQMAETTFKTEAWFFFLLDWCSSRCLLSLGTLGLFNKPNIFSDFS